jgi:hypothetical protein
MNLLTLDSDTRDGPSYTEAETIMIFRPYWGRARVVQEIVLSTIPIAVIGSSNFDLRILYHVLLHIMLFEDQPFDGVKGRVRDLFGTCRINAPILAGEGSGIYLTKEKDSEI